MLGSTSGRSVFRLKGISAIRADLRNGTESLVGVPRGDDTGAELREMAGEQAPVAAPCRLSGAARIA